MNFSFYPCVCISLFEPALFHFQFFFLSSILSLSRPFPPSLSSLTGRLPLSLFPLRLLSFSSLSLILLRRALSLSPFHLILRPIAIFATAMSNTDPIPIYCVVVLVISTPALSDYFNGASALRRRFVDLEIKGSRSTEISLDNLSVKLFRSGDRDYSLNLVLLSDYFL